MSRNRACDSRTEGRNRCDHLMLTNCRAPAPRWKTQEMSDVSAPASTHRKPGGMAGSFAIRYVRVRCGFHRGHGWAPVLATESPSIHRRGSQDRYRYACRISRAWEFGVARAGANGLSFNKTEAGAGATTSGRATAAEVSIDRQFDPQDQFANGVIPQVLPPPIWLVLPSKMVLFHALESSGHRSRRAQRLWGVRSRQYGFLRQGPGSRAASAQRGRSP